MDFNGDYPGSRVKRLRVDTTADVGSDLTVGGTIRSNGDIIIRDLEARDIKAYSIDVTNSKASYSNVSFLDVTGTVPILLNSSAPTMSITSVSSDIAISPYGTSVATFGGLGTTFHSPATFSSVGTVSDLVSTKCSLGTASCDTVIATTSTIGVATATSLTSTDVKATTLTATTSTLGNLTCTTLTTTGQSLFRAVISSPLSIADSKVVTLTFNSVTSTSPDAFFLPGNQTVQFANSGRYLMSLQLQWGSNTLGSRTQWIQGSGGFQFAHMRYNPAPDGSAIMTGSDYGAFTTNSLTAQVYQNSGSSIDITFGVLVIFKIS